MIVVSEKPDFVSSDVQCGKGYDFPSYIGVASATAIVPVSSSATSGVPCELLPPRPYLSVTQPVWPPTRGSDPYGSDNDERMRFVYGPGAWLPQFRFFYSAVWGVQCTAATYGVDWVVRFRHGTVNEILADSVLTAPSVTVVDLPRNRSRINILTNVHAGEYVEILVYALPESQYYSPPIEK